MHTGAETLCTSFVAVSAQLPKDPRSSSFEAHVFGDRVVGALPVVDTEAVPEANQIVSSARVEEAGARERLGLQVYRTRIEIC